MKTLKETAFVVSKDFYDRLKEMQEDEITMKDVYKEMRENIKSNPLMKEPK